MLEVVGDLVDGPARPQDPDHRARVDRARPRRHHQSLEGSHTHRGECRSTAVDGRHGAATTEVGDDEPQAARGPIQELRSPPGRPFDREPVEPVAADAPFRQPLLRNGIPPCRLGQ